jgi:hypothetical protein
VSFTFPVRMPKSSDRGGHNQRYNISMGRIIQAFLLLL